MTDTESRPGTAGPGPAADWDALARYLADESPPEEAARVEAFLAARPADREFLSALDRAMSDIAGRAESEVDVDAALASLKSRPRFSAAPDVPAGDGKRRGMAIMRRIKWNVPFPALAASLAAVAGIAGWLVLGRNPVTEVALPAPRMLATGVGVRDSLSLPDGSRVVLGPLSSVTVAAGYGGRTREVSIRGHAFLDIAHDARRPFTVHAGNATIVDVGTRFGVRSDVDGQVAVAVFEGAVSLRPVNTPAIDGVILRAGDNGLLETGGEVVARRGTVVGDDIAWLSGRLVLKEATIDEVRASMRSWYGIDLRVADPSLASRHITATFRGEPVDRVLDVLGLVLGADIERRGDTAIVRPAMGSRRSR